MTNKNKTERWLTSVPDLPPEQLIEPSAEQIFEMDQLRKHNEWIDAKPKDVLDKIKDIFGAAPSFDSVRSGENIQRPELVRRGFIDYDQATNTYPVVKPSKLAVHLINNKQIDSRSGLGKDRTIAIFNIDGGRLIYLTYSNSVREEDYTTDGFSLMEYIKQSPDTNPILTESDIHPGDVVYWLRHLKQPIRSITE